MRIEHVRDYVVEGLRRALNPRHVAVVGASRHPGTAGYAVMEDLRRRGFQGQLFPVNPRAECILGLRAYASLREVPGEIDLVYVCASLVPRSNCLGGLCR